eukprot:CAMPEP_0172689428 /NCGR_PEP_ID=MMETSP1074-20121228/23132_1 /TAXON_ID=2916 /ORGANISM="Ceratium fusus, Strain PA161109" /LENGTH=127 /DNA_ID=CAMNT_0013509229 /DNA_START=332 /DNA_END=715 /DNA_ORIENTATION=-
MKATWHVFGLNGLPAPPVGRMGHTRSAAFGSPPMRTTYAFGGSSSGCPSSSKRRVGNSWRFEQSSLMLMWSLKAMMWSMGPSMSEWPLSIVAAHIESGHRLIEAPLLKVILPRRVSQYSWPSTLAGG